MRPRTLNPNIAALPTLNGITPWQCAVCGELLKLPADGPIIGAATALGIFSEAHRHTEKHAALLASNPT